MHARTHAADVPYAGGAGPVEVSSKLAIDKRPSWPVAAVGLAGARIFQSQGGRTEETRAPGVEERGGAVYVGVRDSLSISSFLARCNVEVAAATSRVTHAYLQPLSLTPRAAI